MNIKKIIKKVIFRIRTKIVSGNKRAEIYRPYLYHLGKNCEFYTTNLGNELYLLNIHDNVILASNCNLIEHDYSTACISKIIGYNVGKIGQIEIGRNSFIGANATVMPGVTIGENCVIAAGSIVTKDVPSNQVWGGVPAKYIMTIEEYSKKIIDINEKYPWRKKGCCDSIQERQKYFFGEYNVTKKPF